MKCRPAVIKVVLVTASVLCLMWAAAMLYVFFSKKTEAIAVTPVIDSYPLTEMEIPHRSVFIADVRQGDTLRVSYFLANTGSDSLLRNLNIL